jgi:hypothetical protein
MPPSTTIRMNTFAATLNVILTGGAHRLDRNRTSWAGWAACFTRIRRSMRISIPIHGCGRYRRHRTHQYGQKANSFGEFGQATISSTMRSRDIRGVREDHETRELIDLSTGFSDRTVVIPFTGSLNPRLPPRICPPAKSSGLHAAVGIPWCMQSISRGVKSGGFTAHNTRERPCRRPFEPEKLTAYE